MGDITLRQYDNEIENTLAKYVRDKTQDERYTELTLGLFEEAGEVTSIIRKSIKGNYHELKIDFEHLKEEIGDVLWYITQISHQLPMMELEDVARHNLEKTSIANQKNVNIAEEPLSFKQYQSAVKDTYRDDLPVTQAERARLFSMGLIKEVGRISELFGEHRIDSSRLDIYKVKEKLGDGLWYLAAISETYGLDLEEIAQMNSRKTHSRYNSDGKVIKGSQESNQGDAR